jgi:exo-1,4-beta-D-glucosaminidase
VKADVYDLNGSTEIFQHDNNKRGWRWNKKMFCHSSHCGLSNVYFLRLSLKDSKQQTKSINWYWLSQKPDELLWKTSKWFYTPQSRFTDFTALKDMP